MKLCYYQIGVVTKVLDELITRDDLNGKLIVKLRAGLLKARDANKPIQEITDGWLKKIKENQDAQADSALKEVVAKEMIDKANLEIGEASKQETEINFDPIKIDDIMEGRKIPGDKIAVLMDAGLVVE